MEENHPALALLNMPNISVVIPVKDGAPTLERCLDSLRKQILDAPLEIIIADSMSTDDSRQIASRYAAKIITIPAGEFDHGLTRNIGVQQATGDLIFLSVQDAWLSTNDLLQKMANHFHNPDVMAVVGHQAVPHEKDKNPMLWYRPVSLPGITEKRIDNVELFNALPPKQQQDIIAWDDVVAMYRKSALMQQPFVQTAFAEDWIWSNQALRKGWLLLHDSSLVVYHYQHHGYQYAFNSRYTVNYHFYKFFKYKPDVPSLAKPIMRATYHLLKRKDLSLKEKAFWISHNATALFANYFSTKDFLKRLKLEGESGIAKGYLLYCKAIPQGKQQ